MNAKTIKKAIGLNDYQLKRVANDLDNSPKYWCDTSKSVTRIKSGLNTKDISYIDNESFDVLVNFFNLSYNVFYAAGRLGKSLFKLYPLKTIVRIAKAFLSLDLSVEQLKRTQAVSYYADYLTMVEKLDDKAFKPYFKTITDIFEMHDAAVAIYNLKINEIKTEAFQKHVERWKQWEFEKDSIYSVVAPLEPNDLAIEGMTLHHCVKSYIDRVTDGKTNIMFIRKKNELDKPFFTVEVDNNKIIQQVHGFGNCNADTVDGLVDFVEAWAKDKKLKINGIDKVR